MSESIIEIAGLKKSFGRKPVLQGVDLEVPRGSIFGFLGLNGAGKSTTIRVLLGLLKPDAGTCRVCGIDSAAGGVEVRQRVGYMAENQQMYGWMTVREIIAWTGRFYPTWDPALADELRQQMKLATDAKVGTLSKGQSSKLALLLALSHKPELVVLDDPALGLDPLARRDFLRDVIGQLQGRGVSVFFSSHLLYEIEPICDRVAILHEGRIVVSESVETLRARVKRVELRMADDVERPPPAGGGEGKAPAEPRSAVAAAGALEPSPRTRGEGRVRGSVNEGERNVIESVADLTAFPGLLDLQRDGPHVSLIVADIAAARPHLERISANGMATSDLNLDEIFEAYVAGRKEVPA